MMRFLFGWIGTWLAGLFTPRPGEPGGDPELFVHHGFEAIGLNGLSFVAVPRGEEKRAKALLGKLVHADTYMNGLAASSETHGDPKAAAVLRYMLSQITEVFPGCTICVKSRRDFHPTA